MTDELIENKNLPKIKGKFKIPKVLIIILSILLLIGVAGVILWKMGIVAKVLAPKPGSCLILTEENCKKIKVIDMNGAKVAVADLPKDAVLFSPVSGEYNNGVFYHKEGDTDKKNWDFGLMITDSNNQVYSFLYSKISEESIKNLSIKKGDQIGVVNDVKLKKYGDYNFLLSIFQSIPNSNQINLADDLLLKMFSGNK